MNKATGDLWSFEGKLRVVPVNLAVRNNGTAVMGRGVAQQAASKFPGIDAWLGERIISFRHENFDDRQIAFMLATTVHPDFKVVPFTVKHHWSEKADLGLIAESARGIRHYSEGEGNPEFVMPMVGCGFGELDFKDVMPVLEECLGSLPNVTLVFRDEAVKAKYPSSFKPGTRIDRSKKGSA